MGHLEFLHQPLQAGSLFHCVQVLALDVLNETHGEGRFIGHFPDQRGHVVEPGHLRRAPAALAGNQFIAIPLNRPDQHRLHQALRLDGGGQFRQRLLVHLRARLVLAGADLAHRKRH